MGGLIATWLLPIAIVGVGFVSGYKMLKKKKRRKK